MAGPWTVSTVIQDNRCRTIHCAACIKPEHKGVVWTQSYCYSQCALCYIDVFLTWTIKASGPLQSLSWHCELPSLNNSPMQWSHFQGEIYPGVYCFMGACSNSAPDVSSPWPSLSSESRTWWKRSFSGRGGITRLDAQISGPDNLVSVAKITAKEDT